ncbi:MAG: MMPL family transporter [Verrucomicrobiae bacterium]|nr:MMPL family transporter [Verrucomicrobiae bacterium]NNJ85799.1 MMPL family transporter [Akkermansiaceae bacterium]
MFSKPWQIVVLILVVVFSFAGYTRLSFDTDILDVLPKRLPAVKALKDFQKHFAQDRRVIVLLSSETEEVAEEDVGDLAMHLREQWPDAEVTYKSAFEENPELFAKSIARMWSYAPPEYVDAMVARLSDPSMVDEHLAQVKENVQNSFDQQQATMEAYDPLGLLRHPGLSSLLDSDVDFQSDDGMSRILMVSRKHEESTGYQDDAIWIAEIRKEIATWLKAEEYDLSFQMTGGPVYNAEIGSSMEGDMSGTISMTALLVGLLFLLVQRSFLQMLTIGLMLCLTFLITLGMGGWLFGALNLVSVGFAAILLGLVIDYAVVIIRESADQDGSASAIRRMVGPSILWAAATTAIVFGILVMSTFTGVQQLGGLIVIGLIAGAGVMLIFTPVFLKKFPVKEAKTLTRPWFPGAKMVFGLLALVVVGSVVMFSVKGTPQVNMDLKTIEPEQSEASRALALMQSDFSAWSEENAVLIGSSSSLEDLATHAEEVHASLVELKQKGVIESFQWPYDLIPNKDNYTTNLVKLKNIAASSGKLLQSAADAGFTEQGLSLDRQIFAAFQQLPESVDGLAQSCADDALMGAFFDLDDAQVAYFSGRVKMVGKVSPEMLRAFEGFEEKGVSVTGWSLLQSILLPHVKRDFYVIFIPAAGILLLALFIVFRSWPETLIAITVLLTALLLVNVMVVLTGQKWNFLSGMAIPLAVGAGIDYSIHLIFALRRKNGDLAAVWNSVGKAICFCGLSSAIGFGSLLFASNEVLRSMGLCCCLGILLTMSLSLVVIPGLWSFWHRRSSH